MPDDIKAYQKSLSPTDREVAFAIDAAITAALPEAAGKVWHGHPVWFIDGNPIVGYGTKKSGLHLLFWSGQSFKTSDLKPIGKFRAAGFDVASLADLNLETLGQWLAEAKTIQWDYLNLPKKRTLEKLTDF